MPVAFLRRHDLCPQRISTGRRHVMADKAVPRRLIAELIAPGPQPPRQEVQAVLVREADSAVHLVGDAGTNAGGLSRARLAGRYRQQADAVAHCLRVFPFRDAPRCSAVMLWSVLVWAASPASATRGELSGIQGLITPGKPVTPLFDKGV